MSHYEKLKDAFSASEMEQLAQLKRFFECLQSDPNLAQAVNQNQLSPEQINRLKKTGVIFDISEMPLAWENRQNTLLYIVAASKGLLAELDEETRRIAENYPLLKLWAKYLQIRYEECSCEKIPPESLNANFNAWQKRRVAAVKSELGYFGKQISHPSFAYELSDGCSVGCWFCSFAAHKLTGVLDYPAQKSEVESIIKHTIDIFGKKTAGEALPYYRTEPHDSPYYLDFLRDFEALTGEVLCTSTAFCHDVKWIRDLLDYYRRDNARYYWPRLSILSNSMLEKVHDAFSPIELVDIELLIQVKDHFRPKITGGRILEENAGLRTKEDFSDRNSIGQVPQGSIACVSGFNINLLTRAIILFSPSYVGEKWPYGFRVFAEANYKDENDFKDVILAMIEKYMPLTPPKDKILRFRDDIIFRKTENGFDLATPNQVHHFKGQDKYGPLGDLIAKGIYTYETLIIDAAKEYKINPIILRSVIQKLFDDGFLDEIY